MIFPYWPSDTDTSNTAEILAAILQFKKRALLIGGPTRGRTAAVADLPVRKTESGQFVLRYTARRVAFPDMPDPFGKGLTPDPRRRMPPPNRPYSHSSPKKASPAASFILSGSARTKLP